LTAWATRHPTPTPTRSDGAMVTKSDGETVPRRRYPSVADPVMATD
jgi:hypothetical protein